MRFLIVMTFMIYTISILICCMQHLSLSLSLSLSLYIYTNFVEHNRHFLSTHFLVDPFILPYWFYSIRRELIEIFSIIVYIPRTFCPTFSHHQGRIYYKSDVTYVFALLRCKKSVCTVGVCCVYFWMCFDK